MAIRSKFYIIKFKWGIMRFNFIFKIFCYSIIHLFFILPRAQATDIFIGVASVDITPALPAAVDGQMKLRIATTVETPITANIIVIESRESGRSLGISVLISCDLVTIPTEFRDMVRKEIKLRIPGFDTRKIIINATHTHTAAVVRDGWYSVPKGVTQVDTYLKFLTESVSDGIVKAWNGRQQSSITWGLGHAKVAYDRRAVYEDGTAKMYGKTNLSEFRKIEGYEDQDINSLFFWNKTGELVAICINAASPAQIVESRSAINADYWHPVREALKKRFGKDLVVLAWTSAAGNVTPRPMYNLLAENRMARLRGGDYMDEISRRIVGSVEETYQAVKTDRRKDLVIIHKVDKFDLPMRLVTAEEYKAAKKMRDEDLGDAERAVEFHRRISWQEEVIERFEKQKSNPQPMYDVEVHVLRIGDIVLCTNPFELFTDYGIQIRARSKAEQTFILQLVGPGTYLPTEEAMKGGGYSAIVQSNRVGPEGGQILVDLTVDLINSLWP
jgi:hypothetical protein